MAELDDLIVEKKKLEIDLKKGIDYPRVKKAVEERIKEIDKRIEELKKSIIRFRDLREWKKFHNPKDLAISMSIEVAELLELAS